MPTYQDRLPQRTKRVEHAKAERSGTKNWPLVSLKANHSQIENSQAEMRSGGSNLTPATRSLLEPGFGHSLENIRVFSDAQADRLSRHFDAEALTVGQNIFFAQGNYDPGSPWGQHLLAHEVAHAVQQRGVHFGAGDLGTLNGGGLDVPSRHSHSETEARTATRAVMRGQAANLSASANPVVSRWESGEHKHAVDDSIPEEMKGKIKLANRMMVTPGEITAMMGDLYGVFDPKTGQFDPEASFKQMNNADPKEMTKLVQLIDDEAKTGKPGDASAFEKATRNRRDDAEGHKGLSYLELAKKNNSHFSAPDAQGTDNNMGTYSVFHKMALDAAQKGDMETAKALEASGDHYLTDRFSAGHSFEKDGALKASGYDPTGVLANMAVKTAHDDMNNNGVTVKDGTGPSWRAYGDGHWGDPDNAPNREHTAAAVAGSWDELAQVRAGNSSAADMEKNGYSAFQKVPQFDPKNQERAEAVARNTSIPDILMNYGSTAPDALAGMAWREEGKVENNLGDAWNWTKQRAGDAWHAGGKAVDWTEHKATQAVDAAENAASWTGQKLASGVSAGVGAIEDAASLISWEAKNHPDGPLY